MPTDHARRAACKNLHDDVNQSRPICHSINDALKDVPSVRGLAQRLEVFILLLSMGCQYSATLVVIQQPLDAFSKPKSHAGRAGRQKLA